MARFHQLKESIQKLSFQHCDQTEQKERVIADCENNTAILDRSASVNVDYGQQNIVQNDMTSP